MKTARIQMRLDAKLKKQAEQVARRRDMTLSALIVRYLQRAVSDDRLERLAAPTRGEPEQI